MSYKRWWENPKLMAEYSRRKSRLIERLKLKMKKKFEEKMAKKE